MQYWWLSFGEMVKLAESLEVGQMKAISLHEPWASMIARGQKTIETRMWRTNHRGDLLICASKNPKRGNAGNAVAVVRVVDCRPMTPDDEEKARCPCEPGRYAWVLADIREIDPFPVTGKQGFFNVDTEGKLRLRRLHRS